MRLDICPQNRTLHTFPLSPPFSIKPTSSQIFLCKHSPHATIRLKLAANGSAHELTSWMKNLNEKGYLSITTAKCKIVWEKQMSLWTLSRRCPPPPSSSPWRSPKGFLTAGSSPSATRKGSGAPTPCSSLASFEWRHPWDHLQQRWTKISKIHMIHLEFPLQFPIPSFKYPSKCHLKASSGLEYGEVQR